MRQTIALALFAFVAAAFLGFVLPAQTSAQPRDLWAYCAAHPNDPGSGEGGAEDLPELAMHTWRCENGNVLVCYLGASGRACLRTAPMDARRMRAFVQFCRQYPGSIVPSSLATGLASHWTCRGTRPTLDETIPTDRQGYLQGAWRPLSDTRPPPAPARQVDATAWTFPVPPGANVSRFFDPTYPPTENRQHLGLDLPVPAGTPVRSPVTGHVVFNGTSAADVMQSYLILREDATGAEHVLGHIASTLTAGQHVEAGDILGSVRAWPNQPGRSHVHWGANRRGVRTAIGPSAQGDWGWGRAPVTATEAQALARGWIDLNVLLDNAGTATTQSASENRDPSVPAAVAQILDRQLPGWRREDRAEGCDERWRGWMKEGDFDGNGSRDYIVKVRHGGAGYVLTLLSRDDTFEPSVLERQPGESFQNIGINVARRGENYFDHSRNRNVRLRSDAPLVGTCESASTIFIFRNGQFVAIPQGD